MENKLTETEMQKYNQIILYTNNFDSEKLLELENSIYGSLNKKQRIDMEYRRLKEYLKNNPKIFAKYLEKIIELEEMIKVLGFDSTLEESLYIKIVNIQIDVKQSFRLFSILPKVQEELEYLNFYRNQIEKDNRKMRR